MPGILGLGLILLATALLVLNHGEGDIAGLTPEEFASVASIGAMSLVAASWIVGEFRGRWVDGFKAVLLWLVIGFALVTGYAYRYEVQDVALRVVGEIAPGRPVIGSTGEVVVIRRGDGSFSLNGTIEGREVRFIFDTGASMVVLTAESAGKIGMQPGPLDYSVPVYTANGRTMAAPVTIEQLSIGPITERKIKALVARPGALRENLLGMTFLERLASYEVRKNRLILRTSEGGE